jgi:hypothetical protein
VEHYSASILNKVGEGARVLGVLRDAGVNLIAFWGYKHGPGRAQLEFIPEGSATFASAAKQAELRLRKRTALFIHGDDRPGAIADMLAKLAGADINVAALQAVCGERGTQRRDRVPPASRRWQSCECPRSRVAMLVVRRRRKSLPRLGA